MERIGLLVHGLVTARWMDGCITVQKHMVQLQQWCFGVTMDENRSSNWNPSTPSLPKQVTMEFSLAEAPVQGGCSRTVDPDIRVPTRQVGGCGGFRM